MVRIIVGGRELELTREEVVRKLRDVQPEPIREHLVEIASTGFPPKQALEQVTGWNRRSYTTMEAVRVFTRLGFVCRRAEQGTRTQPELTSVERRLAALESALAVAHEAIAGLRNRVKTLEARELG